MKKIFLLSLGISLILIGTSCKIQFWPDDNDEGPEGAEVTPGDDKTLNRIKGPGAPASDEAPEGPEVTPEKDERVKSNKSPTCCDSRGNCYDKKGAWMADPKYMAADFCDECGNCYDYYGNFVHYDESYYDSYLCDNFYYYYDSVTEWDVCGNAYDESGKFLFYDNYYYDYQACNEDSSAC